MSPVTERFEPAPTDLFENEPEERDGSERGDEAAKAAPSDPSLLTMPDRKLRRLLWGQWDAQEDVAHPRNVETEVNRRRRLGDRYVSALKRSDRNEWVVYAPPKSSRVPPTLNKAARLARRTVSTIYRDEAVPDATPATDSDEDRDAAEYATRFLQAITSEAGLNLHGASFESMNLASTYRTVFHHWYIDPTGGGSAPVKMEASPAAQTVDEATHRLVPNVTLGPDGAPVTSVAKTPMPGPFVERMVAADGKTFTEDETQAKRHWLPRISYDRLTSRNVRLVPDTATVREARAAHICLPVQLGELKRLSPKVAELSEEALQKLVKWQPQNHKYLVPPHLTEERLAGSSVGREGKVPNDAIVFTLTTYVTQGPDEPKGARVMIAGGPDDGVVIDKRPWAVEREGKCIYLDIPLSPYRQYTEGSSDPFGVALMDLLGSGDELLQAIWGAFIEHLDRFANRKVFVPYTSNLQPHHSGMPAGSYIPIAPGGKPETEEVPDFPQSGVKLLELIREELNDESGLQEAGQGLDTPSVTSGFHASLVMDRVVAALSEIHQHAQEGLVRDWRLILQLARAFFRDQQLLRVPGEDGSYKFFRWRGADFRDTVDVRVQAGSFTMLSPAQKVMIAQSMFQVGAITVDQLQRIVVGNVGGLIAAQDDPFWLEINDQIETWRQGPPEGFVDQGPPPPQPMTTGEGMPALDLTGQPVMQEPVGDYVESPFFPGGVGTVEPHYDEPDVAAVRHRELRRLLASKRSWRWGPEWRQRVVVAYEQARNAASMMAAMPGAPGAPGAGDPGLSLSAGGAQGGASSPGNLAA